MPRSFASLIFSLAVAPALCAQGLDIEPSLTLDTPMELRAEITPIVWWSAIAADISIAPGDSFDVESIDADEPTFAAGAQARIDAQKLTFTLGGFHRSDDAGGVRTRDAIAAGSLVIGAGSRVDWDLDLTSVKATAGYRFDPIIDTERVTLALDAYAGIRYFDLNFRLTSPAGVAAFDEQWALPVVGVRMRLDLPYEFDVLIETDLGYLPLGDTTATSWEIFAGVGYQPIPNVGVRVGFRHLSIRYTDDTGAGDEEFQGFLAGLYAGVVIRF